MKKIRITADAVLAIIRGIFEDEDVNITVDDAEAPETWQAISKLRDYANGQQFGSSERQQRSPRRYSSAFTLPVEERNRFRVGHGR